MVETLFLLNGFRITVDLSIITSHTSWRLFRYDPRTEPLWLARLAILSSWQEQYEAPCDLLACVWEYLSLSPTVRFLSEEVRVHRQDQPIRDIAGDGEALYVLSEASDTVRVVAPWGLFDTPSLGGIILAIAASESTVGRLFVLREDRSILVVEVFESASFTVLGEAIGVSPVRCERRHFAVVHRMPALAWFSTSSSIGILQLGCVGEAYLSICLTLPERSQFCGIFAVRAGRSSNEVFVFSVEGGSVLRQYSADLRNTTSLTAMRSWRLPVSSYVKGIFSVQVTNVAGRFMLVLGALGRVVVLDSEKEIVGIWENYRCYSAYHLVKYIVVEGKFIYFSCLNAKPYHKVYKQKMITNAIERGRESNARALRLPRVVMFLVAGRSMLHTGDGVREMMADCKVVSAAPTVLMAAVSSSELDKHYSFFEALYHDQACHLHAVSDDNDPILRRLYVGSKEAATDKRLLMHYNITHIVIAHPQLPAKYEGRLKYYRVNMRDLPDYNLLDDLPGALGFIDGALNGNEHNRVLVHCSKGVSRSSSIAIAYVMFLRGLTFSEAFSMVEAQRPHVYPNLGFQAQLTELQKYLGSEQNPGNRKVVERACALCTIDVIKSIKSRIRDGLAEVDHKVDAILDDNLLLQRAVMWKRLGLFFENLHKYRVVVEDEELINDAAKAAKQLESLGTVFASSIEGVRYAKAVADEIRGWMGICEQAINAHRLMDAQQGDDVRGLCVGLAFYGGY
ncbi:hypothetical protein FOZ63_026371 [Perkinsus olseni]|uniref:protein-tyrosine-phosphatase n=1 Tax=Perkinsus olseni TaxID=32597 RepID=A0A7J6TAK0_PEROL|nr:hypothetical protein FOZ63_026371 [Perkinsus olseni]